MENTASTQSNDQYRVDLNVFHGPLDLLLYLINKDELDIYDIPIARITRQYLDYIDLMQNLNLEIAGEFILMAATLIRIKTRMLLPSNPEETDEQDPREELIMALIEYKKYKEAGEILREKALIEERNIAPPSPVGQIKTRVDLEPGTSLFDLLRAFKEVMEARHDQDGYQIQGEEIGLSDRIEFVLTLLKQHEVATFPELFADIPRKIVAVVTFLALLELCRTRRISVSQSKPFAELRVYRGERFDAPREAVDMIGEQAVLEEVH
jgi:segregation and condensation protein A